LILLILRGYFRQGQRRIQNSYSKQDVIMWILKVIILLTMQDYHITLPEHSTS